MLMSAAGYNSVPVSKTAHLKRKEPKELLFLVVRHQQTPANPCVLYIYIFIYMYIFVSPLGQNQITFFFFLCVFLYLFAVVLTQVNTLW